MKFGDVDAEFHARRSWRTDWLHVTDVRPSVPSVHDELDEVPELTVRHLAALLVRVHAVHDDHVQVRHDQNVVASPALS